MLLPEGRILARGDDRADDVLHPVRSKGNFFDTIAYGSELFTAIGISVRRERLVRGAEEYELRTVGRGGGRKLRERLKHLGVEMPALHRVSELVEEYEDAKEALLEGAAAQRGREYMDQAAGIVREVCGGEFVVDALELLQRVEAVRAQTLFEGRERDGRAQLS